LSYSVLALVGGAGFFNSGLAVPGCTTSFTNSYAVCGVGFLNPRGTGGNASHAWSSLIGEASYNAQTFWA